MLRRLALGIMLVATLLQSLGAWLYRLGSGGSIRRRVRIY
jgi:hypothetical protein